MKRNSVNYIDNTYRTLETEYLVDEIVIEGREEILLVLRALRHGDANMKKLANQLWAAHTGFSRCPCCKKISKFFTKGYHSFHRGYDCWICRKCYSRFEDEYYKAKGGEDE